jgi:hypothetical protein
MPFKMGSELMVFGVSLFNNSDALTWYSLGVNFKYAYAKGITTNMAIRK